MEGKDSATEEVHTNAVAQKQQPSIKRKENTQQQQTPQQPIFHKDEKILQELGTDVEKMLFLEGFMGDSSSKRRYWLWRVCLPDLIFTDKENREAEGKY